MKSGYNWVKWSVILLGIIAVIYMFRACNCGRNAGGRGSDNDTISVKRDTIYTDTNTSITYVPQLYRVEVPKEIPVYEEGPVRYLPLDSFPPVVAKMLLDYSSTKYYKDSFDIQYGKLFVWDTLRNNKFIGKRRILLSQSIPEITNTITLREEKRVVGYFGFEILGNVNTPLYATGASFGLKFKNDAYFGVKGMLFKSAEPIYGVEYKRPIRLRKR